MSTPFKYDPHETLIFAVGDIEGRLDLLEKAIESIKDYPLAQDDTIVFLGNTLGDGKHTKEILDKIYEVQEDPCINCTFLMGRDEHKFLRGKLETAKVHMPSYRNRKNEFLAYSYHTDRMWVGTKQCFYNTNKFFFSSAGVNAESDLKDQRLGVLMHNHKMEKFLTSTRSYGKIVVHGTSTFNTSFLPEVKANRIGVYSNPANTGKLTYAVLNDKTGLVKELVTIEK